MPVVASPLQPEVPPCIRSEPSAVPIWRTYTGSRKDLHVLHLVMALEHDKRRLTRDKLHLTEVINSCHGLLWEQWQRISGLERHVQSMAASADAQSGKVEASTQACSFLADGETQTSPRLPTGIPSR